MQQFSSGIVGGFVGVLAFDDLEDFDAFKLLAHDRTEPDFAIFMAAVGKAANHDGHLGTRTSFQMAPHQVGSDVASRSVVNAEIGRTGGQLKVRNKSHYAFPRLPKASQFVDNRRNVLADYGKSIHSARPTFDRFNHRLIGGSAQAFNFQSPITVSLFFDSR